MPIRFRCVYCNQLMGIARRKAGTVVRCPSCASQVTVPNLTAEGPSEKPARARAPAPSGPAPLFERSDFDELFNPGGIHMRPAAAPAPLEPAAPAPSPAPAAFQNEPAAPAPYLEPAAGSATALAPESPAPGKPGIWLTPGMLTLLSVGGIVALMLAFALGFLFGTWLQPARDDRTRGDSVPPVWLVAQAAPVSDVG